MKLISVKSLFETGSPYGISQTTATYPGSGSIGTGAVIRPDWKTNADEWLQTASSFDQWDWEEYAARMGLFPEDVMTGWEYILSQKKQDANSAPVIPLPAPGMPSGKPQGGPPVGAAVSRAPNRYEALDVARKLFTEATSWWGYSVPNLGMINMPQTVGDMGSMGAPGFGFHTKSAETAWEEAKKVADKNPKMSTNEIMIQALRNVKIPATELTPEDSSLMEIGINWYLSGMTAGIEKVTPAPSGVRTGGTPGGPFRTGGY